MAKPRRRRRSQGLDDRREGLARLARFTAKDRGAPTASFSLDGPGEFVPGVRLDPSRVRDLRRPSLSPERDSRNDARQRQAWIAARRPRRVEHPINTIGAARHEISEKLIKQSKPAARPSVTKRTVEGLDGKPKAQLYRGNRLLKPARNTRRGGKRAM